MDPIDVGRQQVGSMRTERKPLDAAVLAEHHEARTELDLFRRAIPGLAEEEPWRRALCAAWVAKADGTVTAIGSASALVTS